MTSVAWAFRKHWRTDRQRLARLHALWLIVVRRHGTEICNRCGGAVAVVFHVPDAIWAQIAEPWDVLCVTCTDDLAAAATGSFLRWTCATDDSVMSG